MEKFNVMSQTENFETKKQIFNDLRKQIELNNIKGIDQERINRVFNRFSEKFISNNVLEAIEYSNEFDEIKDYCEKFFDIKESNEIGFSYELGCRYQKIDFDNSENIIGEIKYLKNLLKIYNENFPEEVKLIFQLILDLKDFYPKFIKYSNTEIYNQTEIDKNLNNLEK
jgi:hypothetical protein